MAKAYTSLGWIQQTYEYDWDGAEENYKRAIELNPNYATGQQWYALLLQSAGKLDKAVDIMERAAQTDPTSLIIKSSLGNLYFYVGANEKALKYAEEALQISPTFGFALNLKYVWLLATGVDGGIEKYEEVLNSSEHNIRFRGSLFQLYLMKGDREAALELFAEIVGDPRTTTESCGSMADMYFRLGKLDLANIWLEKSIRNYEPIRWQLAVDEEFAEWQKHPKFIELMKFVNHPLYVDK